MNQRLKRNWTVPLAMYFFWLRGQVKNALRQIGPEKRKYPRAAISIRVTRLITGSFSYYHALNIGVGGIFLKAQEPMPVGTELRLRFSLCPGEDEIEVKGMVKWIQAPTPEMKRVPGMGIQYTQVCPEARNMLGTFMAKQI